MPEMDLALRKSLAECFPADNEYFSRQSWWHTRPTWRVMAFLADGTLVGHVAMIIRTVKVGADQVQVTCGGVQSFFIRPPWRQSGIADRLMALAVCESRLRDLDTGILFCIPPLEKVYRRMGWHKIHAEVYLRDERGQTRPIPGNNITMIFPLARLTFPSGDIHLDGQDW